MGKKINPIRKINWFLMKKFSFGFKRNYPFRASAKFIKEYSKNKESIVGIEIGTHRGETAEYLLQQVPNLKKLYCIDPYEEEYIIDGEPALVHFEVAKKRLRKFEGKVKFIVKTSDDAVKEFSPSSIDYIYIDGLHTYKQVKKDIKNYFPLLKKEGIIAGDDINRPEIAKAVFEFCKKNNQIPIIKQMDWIIIKNKNFN